MIIDLEPPSREAMSDDEYESSCELAPVVPIRQKATEPQRSGWSYCPSCNHVTAPYYAKCPKCSGDKNRLQVDRLRDVISELKESIRNGIDPERERELVGLLDVYQHPDKQGFLGWLSAQREHANSAPSKRRIR